VKETELGKYPLVILTNVEWDFLWQRQQTLATHFAKLGHRVIYVEGLALGSDYVDIHWYLRGFKKLWRKIRHAERGSGKIKNLPQNVTVYSAFMAPARPRVFRWVSKQVFVPRILKDIASMNVENPVVWSFQPTDTALQVARGLEPRALVYDCATNWGHMAQHPKDISITEKQWVDAANLVIVDSSFLREKHIERRPDVVQIPPGVHFELFNQAYSSAEPCASVQRVGFFGGMGAWWFDFDLVEQIADAGFRVSLVGYAEDAHHRLFSHPNVSYLPQVPQVDLPALLKPMDALLMPYKINDFTRGVFPSKSYECLATGKPVVATPLPDLKGALAEYIYLADDAEGFIQVLRQLPTLETQKKIQSRIAQARRHTWQARLDAIHTILDETLHNRRRPSSTITN
jgi:glycosyltransferase involved in cell wall biosynthesis